MKKKSLIYIGLFSIYFLACSIEVTWAAQGIRFLAVGDTGLGNTNQKTVATLMAEVVMPAFMHIAGKWNWWPGIRDAHPEGHDETSG